jgi:electron transfer flavoprotein alpha subunit
MAGILIVAEHIRGELRDISTELIGAGVILKEATGDSLYVLLIGSDDAAFIDQLNREGVDEIITVPTDSPHFDAALYEEAVCRIAEERQCRAVLVGHSVNGMAFAPAVAARLGSGFASDVFVLAAEGGEIVATRSGYGAKVQVEVGFPEKGIVALTIRGATFAAPEGAGSAEVTTAALDLAGTEGASSHLEYLEAPPADFDIAKSEFLCSIGRGIKDGDAVPRFKELADRLGATLSCSRPVADSGWLPKPHQVGQSGKVAANCNLYLALGISGAVQHLFGMKHVETIIAVNTDPEAPIFKYAQYGACVDLFELADALEKQFN